MNIDKLLDEYLHLSDTITKAQLRLAEIKRLLKEPNNHTTPIPFPQVESVDGSQAQVLIQELQRTNGEGITTTKLCELTGLSYSALIALLNAMERAKQVRVSRKIKPYIWYWQ